MMLPAGYGEGIRVVDETPSTFLTAFAADPPLSDWDSVLAVTQTSGVGQLGRAWISPPGNLYASVRLPAVSPFTGTAAAPAVGALLAEALRAFGVPIQVKWPNDLVLAATGNAVLRKIGGILIQERGGVILAGVGLNIASAPEDSRLRAQAALPAGVLPVEVLLEAGVTSLALLWEHLVAHLRTRIGTQGMTPAQWQAPLLKVLAFRGELVTVRDGGDAGRIQGRLVGVDEQGGLILHTADGETHLYSGSLQVSGEFLE